MNSVQRCYVHINLYIVIVTNTSTTYMNSIFLHHVFSVDIHISMVTGNNNTFVKHTTDILWADLLENARLMTPQLRLPTCYICIGN